MIGNAGYSTSAGVTTFVVSQISSSMRLLEVAVSPLHSTSIQTTPRVTQMRIGGHEPYFPPRFKLPLVVGNILMTCQLQ